MQKARRCPKTPTDCKHLVSGTISEGKTHAIDSLVDNLDKDIHRYKAEKKEILNIKLYFVLFFMKLRNTVSSLYSYVESFKNSL